MRQRLCFAAEPDLPDTARALASRGDPGAGPSSLTWVFSCIPLVPAPSPVPAATPGPAPMGDHQGEQLAGISFLPKGACCEGVPNLGFTYLSISGNCKEGRAPRCSHGQVAVPDCAPCLPRAALCSSVSVLGRRSLELGLLGLWFIFFFFKWKKRRCMPGKGAGRFLAAHPGLGGGR